MPGIAQYKWRLRTATIAAVMAALTIGVTGVSRLRSQWSINPLSQASHAYNEGRWETAAELARRALTAQRNDPAALRLLARSLARLGRADAAIGIYTRRFDPNRFEPEDYLLLGQAYERRGRVGEAAQTWNRVLDSGQVAPRSIDELARLHLQARRWEEAIPVTELLSRQPGWEARGSMMLGTIRATLNNVPGAAESFRRALAFDPAEVDNSQH